jgi:hypothetical protein
MTVRLPVGLIRDLKALRHEHESVNDLITDALEAEVKRRRASPAMEAIRNLKLETERRCGVLSGSNEIIRSLRAGEGRRN